jgi:hypothetical protein
MLVFVSTTRLQLCLALLSALTGTWWGIGTALVVLAVTAARVAARRHVGGWSATPPSARPALAVSSEPALLHASRRPGHLGS